MVLKEQLRSKRLKLAGELALVLGVTPQLAGQRHAPKSVKVPVTSCWRADSLLGPANDEPKSLRGEAFPDRDTIRVYAGDTRKGLEASLLATTRASAEDPDARVYMVVDGAAKRGLFRSADPLRFILRLDDSLFDLGPPRVGRPLSPAAPIGFNIWIGPLMLSKLVRANRVEANLGGAPLETGNDFIGSLRASYRVALCGAPPEK